MRTIIFDFFRTLFNPETQRLIPEAKTVLRNLRKRGFKLILISRQETGRTRTIKSTGLAPFFERILVTKKKSAALLRRALHAQRANLRCSFVVGDRAREEIALGNKIGCTTIWVKQGKFANERPRTKQEEPTITVRKLKQLPDVIH